MFWQTLQILSAPTDCLSQFLRESGENGASHVEEKGRTYRPGISECIRSQSHWGAPGDPTPDGWSPGLAAGLGNAWGHWVLGEGGESRGKGTKEEGGPVEGNKKEAR